MTAATWIFSPVFTPNTFFGSPAALSSCSYVLFDGTLFATISPHPLVVYFAHTTVRLASIASLAKQLNVRHLTAAPARKGRDVIIFEALRATATFAITPVACKYNSFSCFGYIPALCKATNTHQKEREEEY